MHEIVVALDKAAYGTAAWRLASCSSSLLKRVVQNHMREPFQSLLDAGRTWWRRAISFSMLHTELAPLPTLAVSMDDFTHTHSMHATLLSASLSPGYMYQFVRTCAAKKDDPRRIVQV